MPSVFKTKLNIVSLPFNQRIVHCRTKGDIAFLKEFVKHCHNNNAYIVEQDDHSVCVNTPRMTYIYICYPEYIQKINQTTNQRTFYKIC